MNKQRYNQVKDFLDAMTRAEGIALRAEILGREIYSYYQTYNKHIATAAPDELFKSLEKIYSDFLSVQIPEICSFELVGYFEKAMITHTALYDCMCKGYNQTARNLALSHSISLCEWIWKIARMAAEEKEKVQQWVFEEEAEA